MCILSLKTFTFGEHNKVIYILNYNVIFEAFLMELSGKRRLVKYN